MNKILFLLIMVIATVFTSSCGSYTDETENVNLANTDITLASEAEDLETEEEISSLPDKTAFEEVPLEAVESFDVMIESTKELYSEKNGKRLYGYLGIDNILGEDCYLFAVYEETDGVHTEVATVAVEPVSFKMYTLNSEEQTYELVEDTKLSDESQAQWADVVTESFAKYLSADNENSDSVTIDDSEESVSEISDVVAD